MADRGHLEKKPGGGNFLLRFFIVAISKFVSCNGDAFTVFMPKTVTSIFFPESTNLPHLYMNLYTALCVGYFLKCMRNFPSR